jgi:hypothetical protein
MNKNTVKTAIYMNFVLLFCLSIIVGSVAVFAWFSGQGYQGKTMAYKTTLHWRRKFRNYKLLWH